MTRLLGFQANADEHKVQWLSVKGDERFRDLFLDIIGSGTNGGWPRIDRSFFDAERLTHGGFSAKFYQRLGLEDGAAVPESMHATVAAGMQKALECTVLEMAGTCRNLCLGGGLGLNVLLVAALERSGRFENVFVQPAAGNAGNAIGAALYAWHTVFHETSRVGIGNLCLGPEYSPEKIKQVLENCKLRFRYLLTTDELIETAVSELTSTGSWHGCTAGWSSDRER